VFWTDGSVAYEVCAIVKGNSEHRDLIQPQSKITAPYRSLILRTEAAKLLMRKSSPESRRLPCA